METKKRRYVRRTPESYRKEVEEITDGKYSVLGEFKNTKTKLLHIHNVCGQKWMSSSKNFINDGSRCPRCSTRMRRSPVIYRQEVEETTDGKYSVLGDFVDTQTKILHRHNECGYEWEVRPTDFINGGIRCSVCSGWGRSRTPEIYRREVSELTDGDYAVLGEFKNTTTKILHKHLECGHEWEVRPSDFISNGRRCPDCTGRRVFRTAEYYRKEVEEITEGEYSVLGEFRNLATSVLHIHKECGYEWNVKPNSFIYGGSRCPMCSDHVRRTPESYRMEVLELTNGEYSVVGDFKGTATKIPHVHNTCGSILVTQPNTFVLGRAKCPNCFHTRKSRNSSSYCKEVEEISNGEYSVLGEFSSTKSKILHIHNVCGCVWETSPSGFIIDGSRCPKCSTNVRRTADSYRDEVAELTAEKYSVLGDFVDTKTKILHKHNECGHEWDIRPNSFLRSYRCPNCIYSRGEKAVADVLDSLSIDYTREHTFEYLGLKRYDFFIPSLNIAIEYDGEQHFEAVEHWGGEEALKRTQESDALKNDFCDFMGIDLLRIPYWEFDNIDEIVTNFIDTVKLMRSISDRKEA